MIEKYKTPVMFAFFTLIIGLIPVITMIIDSINYGLVYVLGVMISKDLFKYGVILNLVFLLLTLLIYLKANKLLYLNILRIFICFFISSIYSFFLSTFESDLYSDKLYYCIQIIIKPISVGIVLFFAEYFTSNERDDISNG